MTKLTHQERIEKALQAKAKAEAKLKHLADLETKKRVERLARLADKTDMLQIADEVLIPELKELVTRLLEAGKQEAVQ